MHWPSTKPNLARQQKVKRLQMANIGRLVHDRLTPDDQVPSAAIQATLHEHCTGCILGRDVSPHGKE